MKYKVELNWLIGMIILVLLSSLVGCKDSSDNHVVNPPNPPFIGDKYSFYVQLQGPRFKCDSEYCFYDMFDITPNEVKEINDVGSKSICYFSAGTFEDWRKDANKFSKKVIGKKVRGWKGENWLDVRSVEVVEIMKARLQYASFLGCYGVDMDNVDLHVNNTGFTIKKEDTIHYLKILTAYARFLGLKIGLKNCGSLSVELAPMFDWVLSEQCLAYGECDIYFPFAQLKKPVFNIEYEGGCIYHDWIQFAVADLSLDGKEWNLCQ